MTADSTTSELNAFLAGHEKVAGPRLLQIGDVVDGWRVEAFLGSGGNAEVYRVVRDADGCNPSALKMLSRNDHAARLRFKTERDLLASKPGPHLARHMGDGKANGRPYIVTELLEPADLPHGDSAVAEYLLELCSALSSLHKMGIVHRDVKPSNVMRRRSGELVLIDLGLVKDVAKSTEPRKDVSIVKGKVVAMGTPSYAAPEQMNGGEITPAADIHALGRIANAAFADNPPPQWLPIIRRATSSIPNQRYATVDEFAAAVRNRNRRALGMRFGISLLTISACVMSAWWHWSRRGREAFAWRSICEETSTNVVERLLVSEGEETNIVNGVVRIDPKRIFKISPNEVPATVVHLNNRTNVFDRPIWLDPERHYFIEGPGLLSADLRAESKVVVHLSKCWLFNRSEIPMGEANIKYDFGKGAYLNFTEQDDPEPDVLKANVENYDASFNKIRFRGPVTFKGMKKERDEEIWTMSRMLQR